ncbi:MAG: mechanosensitive ion channel [Maricaulaceae bacterium]
MIKFIKTMLDNLPDWLTGGPISAILIIAAGWVVATAAKIAVAAAINRTGLGKKAQTTGGNIGKSIGKALFYIILLVALLIALGQFKSLQEPLKPLTGMLNGILGYGGNLIGAVLLLVIGGVVAKVAQEATSSTLEAAQVDRFVAKSGLTGDQPSNGLSKALGNIVFAILIFGFIVAAIDALGIESLSGPITGMLNTTLDYIPSIFGAAVILGISVFIGRFVSNLAQSTLPALGVDNSLKALGSLDGSTSSNVVPSKIIGSIAFIGIVLMGLTAATNTLGVPQLTNIFGIVLGIGSRVVFGAIIIGAGVFIANFIAKIMTQTSGEMTGKIFKYLAIALFVVMGLNQMNLGGGIVETAFEYSLGAAAFAAGVGGALAFGLGGRDWAGKKLAKWFK